jgi:plastocyanin
MIEEETRTGPPQAAEEPGPRFPPVAYPLLALVFGGILVWSFSRILLAVTTDQAVAAATFMALNILVGSALVAYGRRARRRPASYPLLVAAGLAVVAAGVVAFTFGDHPPGEEPVGGPPPIPLTASGIAFVEQELVLPAGEQVTILFRNQDEGVPHDFVLFDGADATAPELFDGPEITGVASTRYTFRTPPAGSYLFLCSIHPAEMTGTATVVEGAPPEGPPEGGPGGGEGRVEVIAEGTAFTQTTLSLPAHGEVTIHFVNRDAVPHNVSIFDGEDATGQQVFQGQLITGPEETDYTFRAPPPGSYFFQCDVHPAEMTGTITFR